MINITAQELAQATGATEDRANLYLPALLDAMERFNIYTPDRIRMFLANVGIESGGLKYVSEIWGPTAQQKRYERDMNYVWPSSIAQSREPGYEVNRLAYGLGNVAVSDGKRFAGHGLMQVTGRANHKAIQAQLMMAMPGMDVPNFEQNPEQLTEPLWAAFSAGNFWHSYNLNIYADAGDFDGVCDVINIGHKTEQVGDANGYNQRLALYKATQELIV
jgi:putative chitinase